MILVTKIKYPRSNKRGLKQNLQDYQTEPQLKSMMQFGWLLGALEVYDTQLQLQKSWYQNSELWNDEPYLSLETITRQQWPRAVICCPYKLFTRDHWYAGESHERLSESQIRGNHKVKLSPKSGSLEKEKHSCEVIEVWVTGKHHHALIWG